MTARYWVLVAEPVLEQMRAGELTMPSCLRLIQPGDDTSQSSPGARRCYFEDDDAPPELNGKDVELWFTTRGNSTFITNRVITEPLIYEQLMQEFARYDRPEISPAPPPPEAAMGLAQDIKNDYEDVLAAVRTAGDKVAAFAEQRLPEAAEKIEAAESSPAVDAILSAVHVPPGILNGIAKTILDLEDLFAAQAPAPAAPEPAGDTPATGVPVDNPAGAPNLQAGAPADVPAA